MFLGIEIGGTKLQLGLGHGDGKLLALWRGSVDAAAGGEGIRRQITAAVPELLQRLCVMAMEQAIEAAGDALGADDAWAGLCGYIRACVEMRSGALASLAGQIETTDEMRTTAQTEPFGAARRTRRQPRAMTSVAGQAELRWSWSARAYAGLTQILCALEVLLNC